MSTAKMEQLAETNLKKILRDTPEAELVALSRFKSDVVITLKVPGQQDRISLIIPAGYPTPLTEQATLNILAESTDLQRYIKQGVLILVDPTSVSKLHMKEARRLVAKANNAYIHDENDNELSSIDDLLAGGITKEDSSFKIDSSLRNDLSMINNFLKTGNVEDARTKLIQLSIGASPEKMSAIYTSLEASPDLDAIMAEIAEG